MFGSIEFNSYLIKKCLKKQGKLWKMFAEEKMTTNNLLKSDFWWSKTLRMNKK